MHRLDRGRQICRPAWASTPGDEIELSREHVVTVLNTVHTIPSRGFVVWERRNKLKDEFVGPAGRQDPRPAAVAAWRSPARCGLPLRGLHRRHRPGRARRLPGGFEAKILITEMSFIRASHRRDKIHKFGHMHLDDFVERADRFKNELIIAGPLQHPLPPERGAAGDGQQAAARAEGEDEAVGVTSSCTVEI